MIEENVVSSAGAEHQMGAAEMQNTIIDSGFEPWLRGQDYMPRVTSLS
jgi:2-iminoacetate synthase ThiH